METKTKLGPTISQSLPWFVSIGVQVLPHYSNNVFAL